MTRTLWRLRHNTGSIAAAPREDAPGELAAQPKLSGIMPVQNVTPVEYCEFRCQRQNYERCESSLRKRSDFKIEAQHLPLICPTGKSATACVSALSSPDRKNISVFPKSNPLYVLAVPFPMRDVSRSSRT
jgi:hypothetical protein